MKRRSIIIVAFATTLATVAGIVAIVRLTAPEDRVTIGLLYPRTGAQAIGGTEEARGARLAVEWVNAHGGVDGKQVEVREVDVERAEAAPAAMTQLHEDGVDVVIGSHGSAISAAAAHAATMNGMVLWETGAVGEIDASVKGGESFFRLAPMGAHLGSAAIDFIHDQWLPRRAATPTDVAATELRYAVAYVDDAYGRAVAQGAVEEIRARQLPMVGEFAYDTAKFTSEADWNRLARSIGDARADVLFVSAYIDDGVALRRAVKRLGIPLEASIGTSSSYCHPAFGDALGTDAVGLFASDKPDAADVRTDALTPDARAQLAWAKSTYEQRFNEEMTAPALSGYSNSLALLDHVLPASRSMRATDVAAAAVEVKLPLGALANGAGLDLAAPSAFDRGENRRSASVIWEWVAPRTRAVVWPPSLANSDIEVLEI